MAGKILVALKSNDRLEEIIPYIEKIAQPGMSVVFLLRYPVTGDFLSLGDHWVTTESPREAMLAGRRIMQRYSWDVQRGLAEQRITVAREALRGKGIQVAVDVYTDSLRRVVRHYTATGDVHLIMMGAGSGHPMMRLLRWTAPLLGIFRMRTSSPVLLFSPRHV
jgi:hypothetical protein